MLLYYVFSKNLIFYFAIFKTVLLAIFCIQLANRRLMDDLNKLLEKSIDDIFKADKCKELHKKFLECLEATKDSFNAVKIVRQGTGLITKIIGIFENAFFATLMILALSYPQLDFKDVVLITGGWIGLKVVGNYENWSDSVIGRSAFYIFLIGSLFNIMCSFLLGLLVYVIYSNQAFIENYLIIF